MMRKLLVIATMVSAPVWASDCAYLYPDAKELKPTNTVELCSSFFVSRYDPNNKAVVLVAERLLKGTVGSSKRINSFRADSRITNGPKPGDYLRSGYDRGHMAPAQDASSPEQMRETFLMTNMTPQEPTLNEQNWKSLEDKVRRQLKTGTKSIWVVNLAIYHPDAKRINGIPVPSGYWKIVYGDQTAFYYADNKPYARVQQTAPVDVGKLIKNATNF